MGYTYFRVTDERARDVMPKATEIIKDIFKTFPEVSKSLKGSDGYNGEPFIDEEFIIFNGDAEKGEDYETFYFLLLLADTILLANGYFDNIYAT